MVVRKSQQARCLFDAMPALWKNLSCEDRHILVNRIDRFPANVDPGSPIWNKANVRSLLKFGSREDVHKMRASYMVSKHDPSVFVADQKQTGPPGVPVPQTELRQAANNLTCLDSFEWASWKPEKMMKKYTEDRNCNVLQKVWFDHMTNFVSRQHLNTNLDRILEPSAFLDISIRRNHFSLLQPAMKDVLHGSIISDAIGVGAKKKIAKRRINILEGNVASYSRLLNSASQMERIKEMNEVMSIVGEIRGENDRAKEARSIANKVETQEKERKKVTAIASLEQKKLSILPHITPLIDAAIHNEDTIAMWTNKQLQDIFRYFTYPRPVNVIKLDEEGLRNAVRASVRVCREERATVNPIASV